MHEFEQKYAQSLKKIEEMEESLQFSAEQLQIKELKIQELYIIKENFATAEKRIKELECGLESKNAILVSKEQKVKELCDTEHHYAATLVKIKKLENDIQQKTEQLHSKEKMIEDLNATLEKNEMKCYKLEYENTEMKDSLKKERESVKVCLECEIMKDKVKRFQDLNKTLKDTQTELENQRQRAVETLKLLSETEDNFDDMRINKEKEIIKFKDTIEVLQKELRILKFDAREAEKLKIENEKLKMNIEEITLQNNGDFQRLNAENEKLKKEIGFLQTKKNVGSHDDDVFGQKTRDSTLEKEYETNESKKLYDDLFLKKQDENVDNHKADVFGKKTRDSTMEKEYEKTESKKLRENIFLKKQVQKSPYQRRIESGEKMEADSSHDDDIIVLKEERKKIPLNKKFCKEENKKMRNMQQTPNISADTEKRKRSWESESSGSECLEIVMDRDAKKMLGLTPKIKISSELKKSPNVLTPGKIISSQDRKTKRDILNILGEETPSKQNITQRTTLSFSTKHSPLIKKLTKPDSEDTMDFLCFQQKATQDNVQSSPFLQKIVKAQGTPQTPSERKFFKTPLKERDFTFKKPQLQKIWF